MKSNVLSKCLLVGGLVGCIMCVGCAVDASKPVPIVASPAAEAESSTELDLVSVSGKAEVKVVPDKASISFGVSVKGSSAEEVNGSLSTTTANVISALKAAGVEEKSISTDYYSIDPTYRWDDDTNERKLTGYSGTSSLDISDLDIDDVSALISKAMTAGADSVDNIRYYSSKYKESYDNALTEAIAEAREKADKMGEAAGFEVVRVHFMEEGYQDTRYEYATNASFDMVAESSMAKSASAVSAGEVSVEARVSVTYVIKAK